MCSFFAEKKKPETKSSPLPESRGDYDSDFSSPGKTTIGLVVGHNKAKQGARNYLGETEWVFNKRIVHKLQNKLNDDGIRSVIILRPESGGYRHEVNSVVKELEKHGCFCSIHFHFNSSGAKARGCEVLIAPSDSSLDNAFGIVFTDILNEKYGFIERGQDGVKTVYKGHAGYGMLSKVNEAGVVGVLLEPCFGNHRTEESKLIFEEEDKYVDVLFEAIKRTWV